jgi:hypothetical protein
VEGRHGRSYTLCMYARLVEKIARVAELPYHSSDSALDHSKKAKKLLRSMPRCIIKKGQETAWQNPCL